MMTEISLRVQPTSAPRKGTKGLIRGMEESYGKDTRLSVLGQVSIENKLPVDIVMRLQMDRE